MVARTLKSGGKNGRTSSYSLSSPRTSPFQRRAIVNVRYSAARTRGGWKAHGTYIEREGAKGDRENPDAERFGLAKEQSLGSLANGWQKAGDRRLFKIILSPEDPSANLERRTAVPELRAPDMTLRARTYRYRAFSQFTEARKVPLSRPSLRPVRAEQPSSGQTTTARTIRNKRLPLASNTQNKRRST
jgi:hypothetical protein